MGKRGPKPEPTNLKIIKGNPGKRPLNKNEPKPKPIKPECPEWLNEHAKKMWEKISPELDRMGLFTMIDGEAFSVACQSYGIWVECEEILKEKGRVMVIERVDKGGNPIGEYEQTRPEVSIGNNALKNFKTFCSEFGLTPSSRSGIEIQKDGVEDSFADLLSG